jgi:PAS domain S-box-containing protein
MKEVSFKEDQIIVSKTDIKGNITYCNDVFIAISGYAESELLSAPHNILRHKDMPKVVFKLLWQTVQSGEEINAYVKNRTKNGDYYWVFANVTPSMDNNDKIIGYFSVRRKPSYQALRVIEPLYRELIRLESSQGVAAAEKYLMNILDEKGVSYEEFIISI